MPTASKYLECRYLELGDKIYPVYSNGEGNYYFHYRGAKIYYYEVRDGQLLTEKAARVKYPEYFV